jgi:hypothetical protein
VLSRHAPPAVDTVDLLGEQSLEPSPVRHGWRPFFPRTLRITVGVMLISIDVNGLAMM